MNDKKHLLFICTANICRSPTAASLFDDSEIYEAKSAGIKLENGYPNSVLVTQDLIDWADEVIAMSETEDKYLTFLRQNFSLKNKKVNVLEIPNKFDIFISEQKEELIKILTNKLKTYLNK